MTPRRCVPSAQVGRLGLQGSDFHGDITTDSRFSNEATGESSHSRPRNPGSTHPDSESKALDLDSANPSFPNMRSMIQRTRGPFLAQESLPQRPQLWRHRLGFKRRIKHRKRRVELTQRLKQQNISHDKVDIVGLNSHRLFKKSQCFRLLLTSKRGQSSAIKKVSVVR